MSNIFQIAKKKKKRGREYISSNITDLKTPTEDSHTTNENVTSINRRLVLSQPYSRQYSEKSSTRRVLEKLTINKLRYGSVGLVGREKEMEIMQECLSRLIQTNEEGQREQYKEIIFIRGLSGVGKSSLVTSFKEQVRKIPGCVVVDGKFDMSSKDEPYSAIAAAFGRFIQGMDNKVGTGLGSALLSKLGPGLRSLMSLIPELAQILTPNSGVPNKESPNSEDSSPANTDRWKNLFRVFIKTLCSHYTLLVLVFDDLQWADSASISIIESLITDFENDGALMIVGLYRSSEVGEDHPVASMCSRLQEKQEKLKFNSTNIDVEALDTTSVNKVLMSLLADDDESRTSGLAAIVFKRTFGNPFFVIEFATVLEDKGLLTFNLGSFRWTWDEAKILESTMSTQNVVDLVKETIQKLPVVLQLLLEYAACLGSSFRVHVLSMLCTGREGLISDDLQTHLDDLVSGNLIEACAEAEYRWTHDNVKEAVLTGLGDEKSVFRFSVGLTLLRSMEEDDIEEMLFDLVDLLNDGAEEEILELAVLNFRAGEKASALSAFSSTSSYLTKAIAFFPRDIWRTHRDLALRVYTLGAEAETALGRSQKMLEFYEPLAGRKDVSAVEKSRIYMTNISRLNGVDGDPKGAWEYSLEILKYEYGVRLMLNPVTLPLTALVKFMRTISQAKRLKKEGFASLKEMTDAKQLAITGLLSRLIPVFSNTNQVFLLISACSEIVRLGVQHGTTSEMACAISILAIFTHLIIGDMKLAEMVADISLMLQDGFPGSFGECEALMVSTQYIYNWTRPFQMSLSMFREAYVVGFTRGNNFFALFSLVACEMATPLQMGKPLESIEERCSTVLKKCEELSHEMIASFVRMCWQLILNLMGKCEDPLLLKGKIFDPDTMESFKSTQVYYDLHLLVVYGEYERAANHALRMGDVYVKEIVGAMQVMQDVYLRCLALYAAARKSKCRKYIKEANMLRKRVKKWKKAGNPNVLHTFSLLSAEKAAWKRDSAKAHKLYREASLMAARAGNLVDSGLINERYADYLRELGDHEEAKYRIGEAIKFYKDWGAKAKVDMLVDYLLTYDTNCQPYVV